MPCCGLSERITQSPVCKGQERDDRTDEEEEKRRREKKVEGRDRLGLDTGRS